VTAWAPPGARVPPSVGPQCPPKEYGVQLIRLWVKRFVNVHLHCIVSNLKRISKISTLSLSWQIFCGRP